MTVDMKHAALLSNMPAGHHINDLAAPEQRAILKTTRLQQPSLECWAQSPKCHGHAFHHHAGYETSVGAPLSRWRQRRLREQVHLKEDDPVDDTIISEQLNPGHSFWRNVAVIAGS